jgi:RNA polymerase sigma factor (sigma-70 family)
MPEQEAVCGADVVKNVSNKIGSRGIDALMAQFAPAVGFFSRKYAGRGAEASDLEQEGYLALLKMARSCNKRNQPLLVKKLNNGIRGMVRDAADRLRWVHAPLEQDYDDETEGDPMADRIRDERPEQDVADFELREALESKLGPEDFRIVMLIIADASNRDIAREMGLSEQTLWRRLRSIRDALNNWFE